MIYSFDAVLSRVNYGKYIDELQEELEKATGESHPGGPPAEGEEPQDRLQRVIRKQSAQLAREVGLQGNQAMIFMTATSILATAWVSFALRRENADLSKSPEDRLATMEMFDALSIALGRVIEAAGDYADRYQPPAPETPAPAEKEEAKE